MSRRTFIIGGLIVLLAFGCESEEQGGRPLINIDSLIADQAKHLYANNARVTKVATMRAKVDTATYQPKNVEDWLRELEIFRELDAINKPVSRSAYLIDKELYDPSSNLMVTAFTSTSDTPIRSLRIYYERTPDKPRRIEAEYSEANIFYESTRLIHLEFQQVNRTTTLTAYSIDGGQKMILSDSLSFQVRGKIQVN